MLPSPRSKTLSAVNRLRSFMPRGEDGKEVFHMARAGEMEAEAKEQTKA